MVDKGAFDSVGNLLQGGQLVFDLIANLSKKRDVLDKAEQSLTDDLHWSEKKKILTLIMIMTSWIMN